MHRTFLLPEKILWLILFIFVTSFCHLKVKAIHGPNFDNWCSEKHCKNCAESETFRCSENALSIRCGDLCGCCQSCVKFQDLGKSCGSQLAVRSSANKNFEDVKSRVMIIATSSCKRGLVCIDFVCQEKNETVDSSVDTAEIELRARILNSQNGFPESRNFLTDVVKLKNQSQFGYQHFDDNEGKYSSAEYEDALTRKITHPTFTAKPLSSLPKILLKLKSHENQVSKIQESVMPALSQNIIFGSSKRFLNFIIDDKEFQLIYGHDALADLKILLNSVDKNQPNSILNNFETQTIFDRFKNLLDYINNKKDEFFTKKEISLYQQNLERLKNQKNEDINFSGNFVYSKKFPLLKNNEFARIFNTESRQFLAEQLRTKRETENDGKSKVSHGMQYKDVNSKEQIDKRANGEFPVYDFVNETSRAMENVNKTVNENVFYSMELPLLQSFLFSRIPNSRRFGFRIGEFRKKRETKDAEDSKVYVGSQYKNSGEQNLYEIMKPNEQIEKITNREFPVNYFTNQHSETMNDVDKILHLIEFPLRQNFTFSRIPNYKSSAFRIGAFRKKRGTKDAEEFKLFVGPQYKNSEQQNFDAIGNAKQINEKSYSEFVDHVFANKSSDTIQEVNTEVTQNFLHSMAYPLRQNFEFVRIPNTKSPIFPIVGFRDKRESKDAEESKFNVEPQYKNSEQPNFHDITNPTEKIYDKSNTKFPVFNFANEMPRTIETFDHNWPVATERDKLRIDQKMKFGVTESSMNIYMTGIPRPGNTVEDLGFEVKSKEQKRDERDESIEGDYGDYDVGLEVFVAEANAKVPAIEPEENLYNFDNFTNVKGSKTSKKIGKNKADNITENPAIQDSQFTSNVYQFTFPKTLESDSLHELVNETVKEFRDRLDRIETNVVAIGSSMLNHFFEFRSNEKSRITGESKDFDVSMNENPVGQQLAPMNTQILTNSASEKANQFTEIPSMSRHTKWNRFPKENLTGKSQFRRWRDFMIMPNLSEVSTNLKARRRRPNKMRGNSKVDFHQRNLCRKIIPRFPSGSEKKNSVPIAQIPSTRKKLEEDTPKFSRQFISPKILSDADYRHFNEYSSAFAQNNQHESKVFDSEQSSYEMDSDPLVTSSSIPNQKIIWPLNSAWNKMERNKRTSTTKTSANEESIFSLETQIPKPVQSKLSRVFGHQVREKSFGIPAMKPMTHLLNDEFNKQFGEKSDDRNLKSIVTEPSFNLFIVEDQNSKSKLGESLETRQSPQGFVLPAENVGMITTQKNHDVDDNWNPIYPEYLDYSDRAKKDGNEEEIIEVGTTKIPESHGKSQRIDLGYHDRKKRNVKSSLQEENRKELNNWNRNWVNDVSTDLDTNNAPMNKNNIYRSIFPTVFENIDEKSSENMISTSKLFRRRKRRSVQMVDWLRAAEEYHERLHQIRTAALKTWLASRDEIDNSNLTNVKLFTQEIPAYLEKYTTSYNVNDEYNEGNVKNKFYPIATGDSEKTMTTDDELFGNIDTDVSSQFEDRSKENLEQSPEQNSEISSSSIPRKFTIMTTGNSTIRIEEMPKMIEDGSELVLEDHSGQSSMNSEVLNHEVNFMPSESEIFDHMYESIDAEDDDFDYEDSEFTISRLLDEVDMVDDFEEGNVEGEFDGISEDSFYKDEDVEDDNENDDITELFSRTKRDSPFFLFKAKGSPAQDVVIWPSNWQQLIKRHLKFNRSGSSATQPQKGTRRSYVKLSKVIPKHVATLETSAESFPNLGRSSSKVSS